MANLTGFIDTPSQVIEDSLGDKLRCSPSTGENGVYVNVGNLPGGCCGFQQMHKDQIVLDNARKLKT